MGTTQDRENDKPGARAAPGGDKAAREQASPLDTDVGETDDWAGSERLRRLEARIAAAKGSDTRPAHQEAHYSQAQLAWRMVTELVAGLLIGLLMGLGLDTLLGTSPIMMVVFIGLGLAAGVRVMMRTAQEIGERPRGAETEEGRPGRDEIAPQGAQEKNGEAETGGRADPQGRNAPDRDASREGDAGGPRG